MNRYIPNKRQIISCESTACMILAYQRWRVALAIRDGKGRTAEEIEQLVGFDPTECLNDEMRGAKNFARTGKKWRLKKEAIEMLQRHETRPRTKPKVRKKRV